MILGVRAALAGFRHEGLGGTFGPVRIMGSGSLRFDVGCQLNLCGCGITGFRVSGFMQESEIYWNSKPQTSAATSQIPNNTKPPPRLGFRV